MAVGLVADPKDIPELGFVPDASGTSAHRGEKGAPSKISSSEPSVGTASF